MFICLQFSLETDKQFSKIAEPFYNTNVGQRVQISQIYIKHWYCSFKILIFIIFGYVYMCVFVCHAHRKVEEAAASFGTEVQIVLSHRLGAGNQTWVLLKSY